MSQASPPLPAVRAPLLRVDGIRKSFRRRGWRAGRAVILDDVTFDIGVGEAVGLIGSSGAGKSTLARLIAGLECPDVGRIFFEGRDLVGLRGAETRAVRQRIHLIFQDPYDALPPSMRVRDIVAEPLVIHGIGTPAERHERVRDVLAAALLAPVERYLTRYPHELSGGERQRIALARAVILRPRLIVADEPTTMLDVSLRLELIELMRRLGQEHTIAYLYVTHDLALARAFCDRLVILDRGRVVEEGPADEVIERPRHPFTTRLIGAAMTLPATVDPTLSRASAGPAGSPTLTPNGG